MAQKLITNKPFVWIPYIGIPWMSHGHFAPKTIPPPARKYASRNSAWYRKTAAVLRGTKSSQEVAHDSCMYIIYIYPYNLYACTIHCNVLYSVSEWTHVWDKHIKPSLIYYNYGVVDKYWNSHKQIQSPTELWWGTTSSSMHSPVLKHMKLHWSQLVSIIPNDEGQKHDIHILTRINFVLLVTKHHSIMIANVATCRNNAAHKQSSMVPEWCQGCVDNWVIDGKIINEINIDS